MKNLFDYNPSSFAKAFISHVTEQMEPTVEHRDHLIETVRHIAAEAAVYNIPFFATGDINRDKAAAIDAITKDFKDLVTQVIDQFFSANPTAGRAAIEMSKAMREAQLAPLKE